MKAFGFTYTIYYQTDEPAPDTVSTTSDGSDRWLADWWFSVPSPSGSVTWVTQRLAIYER